MSRVHWLLMALGCVLCLVPLGAQQPPYRILVSNADGVEAPGLAAVAQVLQAIGQVVVVAPAGDEPRPGRASAPSEPVFRNDLTLSNGLRAIGLTAGSATVVEVAMGSLLTPPPDLVVSGLDRGVNLGLPGDRSGTVAAARAAALQGVPAIAASVAGEAGPSDLVFAAEEVLGVARRVKQYGLPRHTFLNVNVPVRPADGYRGYAVTAPALDGTVGNRFVEARHPSGRTVYLRLPSDSDAAQVGTDARAVADGYVSVTPVTLGEAEPGHVEAVRAMFQ
jgi:5'-nucleotidase